RRVFFRSGFISNHHANPCPEAQQKVQYGGSAINALITGASICSRGHTSSNKYKLILGTNGKAVGTKLALGSKPRSVLCKSSRLNNPCTLIPLFLCLRVSFKHLKSDSITKHYS